MTKVRIQRDCRKVVVVGPHRGHGEWYCLDCGAKIYATSALDAMANITHRLVEEWAPLEEIVLAAHTKAESVGT